MGGCVQVDAIRCFWYMGGAGDVLIADLIVTRERGEIVDEVQLKSGPVALNP